MRKPSLMIRSWVQIPLSVTNNKSFLASIISLTSEPFQRTDISTKLLGPTILEVLNCGFHKIKGEKARYQQSEE